MVERAYQTCTNCVMDTSDSMIQFDEKGICDHCNNFYERILPSWHLGEVSEKALQEIARRIVEEGKNKKYDCIIGLSGGVDSSYVTYLAKTILGLRPLILCVDTGWNLEVASKNIQRVVEKLELDVYEIVVNWDEMKDLQIAYLKSQVPYQDLPQDHAIFAALYNYAAENGYKYVLTGGNHSTECVREPSEWVHFNDIKQIKDIHKKYGKAPLSTFPMCGMFRYRLYYRYVKGMKIIQPLNMIPYYKEQAIEELEKVFGWEKYQNKHYENLFTKFYEGYWLPSKFGYDKRRAHFSSLILTGQLRREDALELLKSPPYLTDDALEDMRLIADRLDISLEEFRTLMGGENKTYKNYKSSKALIEVAISIAKILGKEKRNFR